MNIKGLLGASVIMVSCAFVPAHAAEDALSNLPAQDVISNPAYADKFSGVKFYFFLPTPDAGRVGLGSEARIVLDAAPDFVVPATVSFVAAEAQFTPKFVETENEREKLMYRIKVRIDPALLETYRDYVKAGLTGNAYLKVQADAAWPATLTPKLPPKPGDAQ